ncbi:hypothetical protein HY502_01775 [Candidatus Woesebacteria bacterium]|nr:hypothetical protein [Candidatus Woesebacteria bacterium]
MAKLKKQFSLILICVLIVLFYGFISSLYFSQDDFFHLRVGQTGGSLKEFLDLFSFRSFSERGGIYFYRPIFREGLFNLFYQTFGLNPVPFRIFQLAIHLVNTLLVYKLFRLLTKKEILPLVAALVFGISAANIGVLSYLAGGIQASGMTLFLLTSALLFLMNRKLSAFLFFVLALGSHELAISYPFILAGFILTKEKLGNKFLTRLAKELWPHILVVGLFLYFQVKVIGLPIAETEYGFSFSISRVLNSYVWYLAWSIGLPEMLLDFIGPGLKLNPNLMAFWGNYFKIIFPLFVGLLLLMVVGLRKQLKNKFFWLFTLWFVLGISPVTVLPLHRSTYYLAFSLVGIAGIIGLVFEELYSKRRALGYLLIGSFVALSLTTVFLSKKTFWAITRAKIAKDLILEVKNSYPSLPKGATVYFLNDPDYPVINEDWGGSAKQAKVVLSGSDALILLYRDESLKVLYEGESLESEGKYIFPLVAKIRI